MTDYRIVVYATHARGMFHSLMDDANAFNVPVTLLGWGEPWVGYRQKIEAILAFVRTLSPETIVISLDAYDTKLVRHPQGAVRVFEELNVDICFSSERTTYPFINLFSRSVFKNTCSDVNKKYINAGMYMGYAGAIVKLLTYVLHEHPAENDDQRMFNMECKRLSTMFKIHVDQSNIIFKNIHISRLFAERYAKLFTSKSTSGSSYFVSYPGSGGRSTFDSSDYIRRSTRDVWPYSKMIMTNNKTKLKRFVILLLLIWLLYIYCRLQTKTNQM